ncbi:MULTISPECIES: hypothetical protein [unclassified Roseateles]|uniref:hypothetical protein n=1 Tax=unclassified Roseateles TaxID=2626991 RepID=UPI0007003EE8|nr:MULTISPECIES: hypothetical protein [unclassified Roseateles]KQW51943.1 hypothetical protein ASC81_04885 [Pelomonas sp. Root405]KRA78176.1 hypothetical protein ASD88_04890 [Pelomonas sp. Root662]
MPTATPASTPAQPRLLSGAGGRGGDTRTRTGNEATSFTATVPFTRPQTQAPATPAPVAQAVPRWAKGVVIGGLLLAVGMPASVLMSRSMLVQSALMAESNSKAAMVCTGGQGRAVDGSSVVGWLFSGSYFSCGDWETREARKQRERDQAEASYMARQRARQQAH